MPRCAQVALESASAAWSIQRLLSAFVSVCMSHVSADVVVSCASGCAQESSGQNARAEAVRTVGQCAGVMRAACGRSFGRSHALKRLSCTGICNVDLPCLPCVCVDVLEKLLRKHWQIFTRIFEFAIVDNLTLVKERY